MQAPKNIPLHEFHAQKGARFVNFAGWNMPVQYTSIIKEHLTVRHSVGLFDVSHMGEIFLSGEDSIAFLNHLCTNDYSTLKIGQSKYTMMCYEDGGVVDDLIIYRLEEALFLLCVNASNIEKDFDWMNQHAPQFKVSLSNDSQQWALLALQGPESERFLEKCGVVDSKRVERFHHISTSIAGVEVILSRTGYTGEDGFEIYIPVSGAMAVANAIATCAEQMGFEHFYCGLGCRDSLRLEAGYPLYGHEISDKIDPITALLGWTVKLDKPMDFIGKKALESKKKDKPSEVVKFFLLDDRRIARQGEDVWLGERRIGEVLSGGHSPIAEQAIGSCLIARTALSEPADIEVRLRGRPISVKIKKPPLHEAG